MTIRIEVVDESQVPSRMTNGSIKYNALRQMVLDLPEGKALRIEGFENQAQAHLYRSAINGGGTNPIRKLGWKVTAKTERVPPGDVFVLWITKKKRLEES